MKHNGKDKTESFLYHFTRSDTAIFNILPTMKLRVGDLENTNDPREKSKFKFGAFEEVTEPDDPDYFEKRSHQESVINFLIKQDTKVLSFCTDYYDEQNEPYDGFNHPRMWSQYAENHLGVCLKIDKELFLKENEGILISPNSFTKEIIYKSSQFDEPFIDYPNYLKNRPKYADKFKREHIDYLFFTKDLDWSSEHEFRILIFSKEGISLSIKNSLAEVILGMDFDKFKLKVLVKSMREDLEQLNFKITQADYDDSMVYPARTIAKKGLSKP